LISILILFLAGALPAAAATAQGPAVTPDGALLAEVSSLNRSMEEIVGLLEEFLKRQQADLLMKRIQISTRGLTELERRLDGAKDERRHIEDEIQMVRQAVERLEEEARAEEDQPGLEEGSEDRREQESMMGGHLKLLEERLQTAEIRVLELEDDLGDRLDNLAAWEELVDKALGLR
jgi:chromosome segregation ATPase